MQGSWREKLLLVLTVLYLLACLGFSAGLVALILGGLDPVLKNWWWALLMIVLGGSLVHRFSEIFGFDARRRRQGRAPSGAEHLRGYFLGYPTAEDDETADPDGAEAVERRKGRHEGPAA